MSEPRTSELPRLAAPSHEHGWITESSHHTLDGVVVYVRCAACGARRIDLLGAPSLPAAALSREV